MAGRSGSCAIDADLQSLTDADLVSQVRAGSELACRELVGRYQRPVFNLLARLVGDRSVAEELAQETFLKAFLHLDRFDPARRFTSWVLTIAHRTGLDHLRRGHVGTIPLDPDELDGVETRGGAPDPQAALERQSLGEALDAALNRLRPIYRTAVILRYQEELSYEEIAEITELPLGTVKTFLHRARRALAADVGLRGWNPGPPEATK